MLDDARAMIDSLLTDIRYAARSLRRTPAFTATALVTLALGIGANTAIFSLVNAVMLRPLPVPDPDALVFVGSRNLSAADTSVNLLANPAWLQRIRQETTIFSGVAAYNIRDFKVTSADGVEQVVGQYATGNYHTLVGVPMALGRGFATENDFAAGSSPIAVISDKYWQRRYQRQADVLGMQIVVGGHPVTIVGVTVAGFDGMQPGRSIDITLPLSIRVQDEPDFVESLADGFLPHPADTEDEVQAFVRTLIEHDRIDFGKAKKTRSASRDITTDGTKTHAIIIVGGKKVLKRLRFLCGAGG